MCWTPCWPGACAHIVISPVVVAGARLLPWSPGPCLGDISWVMGSDPSPSGPLVFPKVNKVALPNVPSPAWKFSCLPGGLLRNVRSRGGPVGPRWGPCTPSAICHDSSERILFCPPSSCCGLFARVFRLSPFINPNVLFIIVVDMRGTWLLKLPNRPR